MRLSKALWPAPRTCKGFSEKRRLCCIKCFTHILSNPPISQKKKLRFQEGNGPYGLDG